MQILMRLLIFIPRVIENIKEEIINGVTWKNSVGIPCIEDQINLAEKGINEDLKNYQEEILVIQKEKEAVINKKKKRIRRQ